tara:strand:+ start:865 stop:1344 length:480 start_codon:yes stop_codon:yes gene_type:complete
MTWKDILKIDMEEARRLGEKYAPRDMKQGEIDRIKRKKKLAQLQAEETLPKRRAKIKEIDNWLDKNEDNMPEDMVSAVELSLDLAKKHLMDVDRYETYMTGIKMLLRELPNNPFMRGKSKEKPFMYRSPVRDAAKKQTSLIDRAKKANRDDPRMGSGRR